MRQAAYQLEKPFSLYLDLARFTAAAAVLLAHYLQRGVIGGPLAALLPDFGREAVILFFVLSGFVIACTIEQKQQSAADYALARCARIYSVALPVLLLAFAVAALSWVLFGVRAESAYQLDKPWLYLPLHLLFLGQSWTLAETPPWLIPYWSLNFEVWYYVLFGLVYYLRGAARATAAVLALAVMGYKMWMLLPVWASGVWLYHWQKQHTMSRGAARAGWMLTLLVLALFKAAGAGHALRMLGIALWPFPSLPLGSADRFLADYLVCLLFLANFACARHAGFERLLRFAAPVRRLAARTFTLYLSHFIVVSAWLALYPHDATSALDIAALTALVAAVTVLLGALTEGSKDSVRARLASGMAGWRRQAG